MNHPPSGSRPWLAGAAMVALVAAVGCSQLPNAPIQNQPGTYASPKFAVVPASDIGRYGTVPSGPITGSAVIDGALGGVVTVGRFTVTVPAGAFSDTATITITMPNPSIVECNLDISPVSANGFHIPVSLTADCSGVTNVDLRNCGTLWFDPSANVWRTVTGATVDLTNSTVTAALMHFSTYGVADLVEGRASW